jgi:CelD/BcsL family acetyltransferase involved in cellulose biosynthesis
MNFTHTSEFPNNLLNDWTELLKRNSIQVPFLEYHYQKLWWETKGGGEWQDASLMIIQARKNDRLVGIAPLFSAKKPDGTTALFNVGCIEVSDYLDLLVLPEDRDEFIGGLLDYIRDLNIPGLGEINLYNLLDSSPTLAALENRTKTQGWSLKIVKLQHSPYIPLPGDWETYLSGIDKKQRHEIRRKMRRAEEAEVPVRWYFANDPAVLDKEIDAFLELMKNDGDKVAFLRPAMQEFIHRVVHFALACDCLQLAFLEVDGQKAAAYLSFDYMNRIWVYNSGLNREFQSLSPGWVLLGYLLQWANENNRTEFDFMRGEEEYKYRFGAKDRFVMHAVITPDTIH